LERTARSTEFVAPSAAGLVWLRFRRERLAFAALVFFILLVLMCFAGEPLLERVLGHGPDTFFPPAVDVNLHPAGPWSWIPDRPLDVAPHSGRTLFVLGADGPLGRDEFLRLLAGGRLSLEIAAIATVLALGIGVTLGTVAGWAGGWTDTVIARLTELTMAFPILLLVIAIGQTIAKRFDALTLHGLLEPGVLALGVTIGLFSWFYPARVVRALTQSLRQYEFVEAARTTGAGDWHILRKHVLPHVAGPAIVWGTLVAGSVIVLEAALSVLNFGVKLGTASWGNLLSSSWGSLLVFDPFAGAPQYPKSNWLLVWPTLVLFVAVLSLALIGDGLRSALDPRGEG
jgi:ABC-type dipeptide/oligopeptide/nickel transport system permease subunit